MQVCTLDHFVVDWKIRSSETTNKSNLHLLARELLGEILPTIKFFEEVTIPLYASRKLFLDFYIPLLKTAVEVQGEQHFKFVPHFHNNKLSFFQQQRRDFDKKTWCELNNINLITLLYNENREIWKTKLQKII